MHRLNIQFIQAIRGETESMVILDGTYFDESHIVTEWIESQNANALFDYYLCKLRLNYFTEIY